MGMCVCVYCACWPPSNTHRFRECRWFWCGIYTQPQNKFAETSEHRKWFKLEISSAHIHRHRCALKIENRNLNVRLWALWQHTLALWRYSMQWRKKKLHVIKYTWMWIPHTAQHSMLHACIHTVPSKCNLFLRIIYVKNYLNKSWA